MVISGIYKITCIVNNKFYIGSSKNINKRWKDHIKELNKNIHDNSHFQNSWNKYGSENFIFEIIEEYNTDIPDLLLELEQTYLDNLKPYNCNIGFNIAKKSKGGDTISNNPKREEIIQNIRNGFQNYLNNRSEEEKQYHSDRSKGENNGNFGKRWTEEKKEDFSNFLKIQFEKGVRIPYNSGKTNIEYHGEEKANEISKKISVFASQRTGDKNSFFGRTHKESTRKIISEKNKGKIPTNIKPFIIDNIRYEHLKDASEKLDIPTTTILWRLKSKNPKYKTYLYIDKETGNIISK